MNESPFPPSVLCHLSELGLVASGETGFGLVPNIDETITSDRLPRLREIDPVSDMTDPAPSDIIEGVLRRTGEL